MLEKMQEEYGREREEKSVSHEDEPMQKKCREGAFFAE